MTIYTTLDDIVNNLLVIPTRFKSSRLYIKRILRENGTYIYYFGKSWKEDLLSYNGSGVRWSNFIKKYGNENVEHVWESDWYYDSLEIQLAAIRFSLENNIVESVSWANSKIENGLDGGLISDDSKKSISDKLTGIKRGLTSGTSGTMWINDGVIRTCIPKNQDIPEGWTKGRGITQSRGEIRNTGKLNSVYGKIKYNNGIEQKYFNEGEKIPTEWKKGGLPKNKLRSNVKGKNNSINGKKKYNNGYESKYFSSEDIIPDGWSEGNTKSDRITGDNNPIIGKKKYNNGKISKYFGPNDEIPERWVEGGVSRKSATL